ncbi:unnamed protein product [Brachionus calyciflorus]|uniref:Uncharacterized protein n=1 Tax=Brachionus calyciflorus TaxID=104777 RepID=A0A813ZPI8_9BILA|nr:unnamed protein product [Brachionus calyciflorus]
MFQKIFSIFSIFLLVQTTLQLPVLNDIDDLLFNLADAIPSEKTTTPTFYTDTTYEVNSDIESTTVQNNEEYSSTQSNLETVVTNGLVDTTTEFTTESETSETFIDSTTELDQIVTETSTDVYTTTETVNETTQSYTEDYTKTTETEINYTTVSSTRQNPEEIISSETFEINENFDFFNF